MIDSPSNLAPKSVAIDSNDSSIVLTSSPYVVSLEPYDLTIDLRKGKKKAIFIMFTTL